MKKLHVLSLLAGILLVASCTKEVIREVDVERTETYVFGEVKKVLVLGNSITFHVASPELDWNGSWGMAASCEANDYIHRLMSKVSGVDTGVQFMYAHVGSRFEVKFWDFDTSDFVAFRDFEPDLIIIRLGENVKDEQAMQYDLGRHLHRFIDFLKNGRKVTVCCTDSFWPNTYINQQIEQTCSDYHYLYAPVRDLYNDEANRAKGYENVFVNLHPSDVGMQKIADRVWEKISILF